MKKILWVVGALAVIAFGFAFAMPAHAQELSPTDAAALKTSLDELGGILTAMQLRLAHAPEALGEPMVLSAKLEAVETGLAQISKTFSSLALVEAPVVAVDEKSPSVSEPLVVGAQEETIAVNQMASAGLVFGMRTTSVVVILILLVAIAVSAWLIRRKNSVPVATQTAASNQASIPLNGPQA